MAAHRFLQARIFKTLGISSWRTPLQADASVRIRGLPALCASRLPRAGAEGGQGLDVPDGRRSPCSGIRRVGHLDERSDGVSRPRSSHGDIDLLRNGVRTG